MARSNSGTRRHKHKATHATASLSVGTCTAPGCSKKSYTAKKHAKNAAKTLFPGSHSTAYQCETGYWHFGRPPQAAMAGIKGRREVYASA